MSASNTSRGLVSRLGRFALVTLAAMSLTACGFNSVPTKQEAAKAKWADVEAAFQERANLVPNLAAVAKGNVMDLAVGVIIGAAFGAIVKSLTDEVIMPVAGAIFGGSDFSNNFILLSLPDGYTGPTDDYAALKEAGAAMIGYGSFITAVINFLILAFIVFLMVRYFNRMMERFEKKQEEAAPAPAGPSEIDLLTEIRDELKKRG